MSDTASTTTAGDGSGKAVAGFSDALARVRELANRVAAAKAAAATTASPGGPLASPASAASALASLDKRRGDDEYESPNKRRAGLGSEEADNPILRNIQEPIVVQELFVPNANVGLVIGKGGETIRRLEIESQCRVQVGQDVNAPERRIQLTGTKAQRERAMQMIQDIIERRGAVGGGTYIPPTTTNTEHYHIPSQKVGSVIGRGGETIRDIERRSGAIVQVTSEAANVGTGKRVVVITGDEAARTRAKVLIDEIASDELVHEIRVGVDPNLEILQRAGFKDFASRALKGPEDTDSPRGSTGPPNYGDYASSGAHSPVYENPERRRDREAREGAEAAPVQPSQTENPHDFFARELASFKDGNTDGGGAPPPPSSSGGMAAGAGSLVGPPSGGGGFDRFGPNRIEVPVPAGVVGLLIGRGGENIRRLEAQFGARFVLPNESIGQTTRTGIITGEPAAARRLEDEIRSIIQQAEQRDAMGPRTGARFQGQPNHTIKVPADRVGTVIGRGGETIKFLERSTGARIHVDQNVQAPERCVFVVGNPDQCAQVEQLVWAKINEAAERDQMRAAGMYMAGGGGGYGGYMDPYAQMYGQYGYTGYGMMPGMTMDASGQPVPMDPAAYAQAAAAAGIAATTSASSTDNAAGGTTAQPQGDATTATSATSAAGDATATGAAAGAPGGPSTNGTYDGNYFYAADYPGWRYNYTSQQWEPIPADATVPVADASSTASK